MIQRFLKKGVVIAISYNQRIPLALYHQNAHLASEIHTTSSFYK